MKMSLHLEAPGIQPTVGPLTNVMVTCVLCKPKSCALSTFPPYLTLQPKCQMRFNFASDVVAMVGIHSSTLPAFA